ncbi:toprim domain-containing protein [Paenibacillus agilis]|uniref:Toprim domain-containing protein n=1 Tax=Paenibacillus agilis TaxID=3020863 RepID=A0A559IER8_9BACL|nr:toprim domain-containing protein [Paenibacillus agilis]TVX86010.1 toprim domain-containing protein [Paenibacillus agilis]
MNINDLPIIKERIYEEGLVEPILEALECEYITPVGTRWEAQLPERFHSNNRRSVQVYLSESLPSKVRSKQISGDIYMLVGYILYEVETFDELKDVLHQVKAWICNLLGWHEYLEMRDDFEEVIEKKDYLSFLRPTQKARKKRKRMQTMRDKENQVLDKDSVFSWYRAIPHEHFIEDGISVRTQRIFEVMFDETTMRVVFPVHNSQGELVSIKGRYVGEDEWVLDEIKYLYLYSYDKSIELFNYHRALQYIKETGEVIVFESEKSCMKAFQYGFKNCVAICGSELSPVQAHMLIMLGVDITFAFDNDMDDEHVRKQAKQIRTRKCFWIKDTIGLLGEKDAPVDKGKVTWENLINECRSVL